MGTITTFRRRLAFRHSPSRPNRCFRFSTKRCGSQTGPFPQKHLSSPSLIHEKMVVILLRLRLGPRFGVPQPLPRGLGQGYELHPIGWVDPYARIKHFDLSGRRRTLIARTETACPSRSLVPVGHAIADCAAVCGISVDVITHLFAVDCDQAVPFGVDSGRDFIGGAVGITRNHPHEKLLRELLRYLRRSISELRRVRSIRIHEHRRDCQKRIREIPPLPVGAIGMVTFSQGVSEGLTPALSTDMEATFRVQTPVFVAELFSSMGNRPFVGQQSADQASHS